MTVIFLVPDTSVVGWELEIAKLPGLVVLIEPIRADLRYLRAVTHVHRNTASSAMTHVVAMGSLTEKPGADTFIFVMEKVSVCNLAAAAILMGWVELEGEDEEEDEAILDQIWERVHQIEDRGEELLGLAAEWPISERAKGVAHWLNTGRMDYQPQKVKTHPFDRQEGL